MFPEVFGWLEPLRVTWKPRGKASRPHLFEAPGRQTCCNTVHIYCIKKWTFKALTNVKKIITTITQQSSSWQSTTTLKIVQCFVNILLDKAVEELHIIAITDEFPDHLFVQSGIFSKPLGHLVVIHWITEKPFLLKELDSLLWFQIKLLCSCYQKLWTRENEWYNYICTLLWPNNQRWASSPASSLTGSVPADLLYQAITDGLSFCRRVTEKFALSCVCLARGGEYTRQAKQSRAEDGLLVRQQKKKFEH